MRYDTYYMHHATRVTQIVATCGLIASVWAAGWITHSALLARCGNARCQSFLDYELTAPLCIIDPACVSPLYSPAASGDVRWMGLESARLSKGQHLTDPLGFTSLALFNLCLLHGLVAATWYWLPRNAVFQHFRRREITYLALPVGSILTAGSWLWQLEFSRRNIELSISVTISLILAGLLGSWLSQRTGT